MYVKYVFFTLHTFLILVCLADVNLYPSVTLLQCITILSWKINNNNCIITQIEDYFFDETLVDVYYKFRGVEFNSYHPYRVPSYQRFTIYFLFTIRMLIFGIMVL